MSQQNVYQADLESAQVIKNVHNQAYQVCSQYANEYVRIKILDGSSYEGVIVGLDNDHVYMEIEEDQPDISPVHYRPYRCLSRCAPPPYPVYPPFPPFPPYPPYPVYEPVFPTYNAPRRRRRRRILPLSLFTLLSIVLLRR